jgi:imidazolonepropionase-like amidohydrolase
LLRAAVLLVGWAAVARGGESIAIHGKTIHTMAGAAIADGVVLVADGKIVAVGPAAAVPVPAGARTLRAEVVTPGLIDAHCVIGLAGYLNQDHDQDQFDATEPVQPELRAIDAYNPASGSSNGCAVSVSPPSTPATPRRRWFRVRRWS